MKCLNDEAVEKLRIKFFKKVFKITRDFKGYINFWRHHIFSSKIVLELREFYFIIVTLLVCKFEEIELIHIIHNDIGHSKLDIELTIENSSYFASPLYKLKKLMAFQNGIKLILELKFIRFLNEKTISLKQNESISYLR